MHPSANVAQLVEQLIRNEQVTGSSPVIGSKTPLMFNASVAFVFLAVMQRTTLIVVLLLSAFLALACTRETEFGEHIDERSKPVSVREARAVPNRGKTLVVRGEIKEVCQDEGCWFALTDHNGEIITRFTVDGIGIPVISAGTVLVKGVVRDTVIGNIYVPELRARGVKFVTSQP